MSKSPLFENRYYATDSMLSEYVYKVICKKLRISGAFVSLVAFIMLIFTIFAGRLVASSVFATSLFIAAFVSIFAPMLILRQIKDTAARMHNGKSCETIVLFGDNIHISEGSFSLTVEYSQISDVHILKRSYALMFGRTNGILLSPCHFTVGSADEFIKFLAAKNLQISSKTCLRPDIKRP